jgi:formiminoglutamase
VKEENNYDLISPKDFVLHGFAVDEGVRRNKGRQGAKDAPDIIRKNMSNFPVILPDFSLLDFGNITCEDGNWRIRRTVLPKMFPKCFERREICSFRRRS